MFEKKYDKRRFNEERRQDCNTCRNATRGARRSGRRWIYKPKNECEVCHATERLVWDHCHTTGAQRGVLCGGCNIALGMVRDRPDILRALANYIEKFTDP